MVSQGEPRCGHGVVGLGMVERCVGKERRGSLEDVEEDIKEVIDFANERGIKFLGIILKQDDDKISLIELVPDIKATLPMKVVVANKMSGLVFTLLSSASRDLELESEEKVGAAH